MNKKVVIGLAVGVALILLVAGLYYLSTGKSPQTGLARSQPRGAEPDGAGQAGGPHGRTPTAQPQRAAGYPRH